MKCVSSSIIIALLSCVTSGCKWQESKQINAASVSGRPTNKGLILGCPQFLIAKNISETQRSFQDTVMPGSYIPIDKSCFALDDKEFKSSLHLERYLARHDLTNIGVSDFSVNRCVTDYVSHSVQSATSQVLQSFRYKNSEVKFAELHDSEQVNVTRKIISDYYFYMNTLKQAAQGVLEGIAAYDLLLGGPVLTRAASGQLFSDEFIPGSDAWLKKLRTCSADPGKLFNELTVRTRDVLVVIGYNGFQMEKMDHELELLKDAEGPQVAKQIAMRIRNRDDLRANLDMMKSIVPWINGEHMKAGLYNSWRKYVGLKIDFRLSNEAVLNGIVQRVDEMSAPGGKLVKDMRTQFEKNRELLVLKLNNLIDSGRCLHSPYSSKCDTIIRSAFGEIAPFEGARFSERFTKDDDASLKKLFGENSPYAWLEYHRKFRLMSAVSSMFSSQCRQDLRQSNTIMTEARKAIPEFLLIYAVTGGLGSWLNSSKLALATQQARNAESVWVSEGVAHEAIKLNRLRLTLASTLAATDLYWMKESVLSAVKECKTALTETISSFISLPHSTDEATCLTNETSATDSLSMNLGVLRGQHTKMYVACLTSAGINFLLGVAPVSGSVKGYFKTPQLKL